MGEGTSPMAETFCTLGPGLALSNFQDNVTATKPSYLSAQKKKRSGRWKGSSVKGVALLSAPAAGEDAVRAAALQALCELGTSVDEPVMLMDLGEAVRRLELWRKQLPRVRPHYAVKCNPDRRLMQQLMAGGCGFDCATMDEIERALGLGVPPDDIVFSNPCKLRTHLKYAKAKGVTLMTFDNVDELRKVASVFPSARMLLRLFCQDSTAQCPMSNKYGAPREVWAECLDVAVELKLNVVGVHFHVGSGCKDPTSFETALQDAREVFRLAREHGMEPDVLDIGGGFPGAEEESVSFPEMAASIVEQLERHFPETAFPGLRIIAEPGRFFASSVACLLTKVFAKAEVPSSDANGGAAVRYYLNDGLYGSFNCVLYDHAEVTPEVLELPGNGAPMQARPIRNSWVFGPTCDGFDKILEDYPLPELNEGDWVLWRNMGAYTTAACTKFNGFPLARGWYYRHGPANLLPHSASSPTYTEESESTTPPSSFCGPPGTSADGDTDELELSFFT